MESIHEHDTALTPETTLEDLRLLPSQRGAVIEKLAPRIYPEHSSATEQLLRLARVDTVEAIGSNGPVVAALEMPAETIGPDTNPESRHLFEALFGRDSEVTADILIDLYPNLARNTLLTLGALQGLRYDDPSLEKPGGIIHEHRDADDPIAIQQTQNEGWGWPFYGTVDATPGFVKLLARYVQLDPKNQAFLQETIIDRSGTVRTMESVLDNALHWIDDRRTENPEGLVEYNTIKPQAWKDSHDAYHHADGTIANHLGGIASIEVQVATYDAYLDAADLYDALPGNETYAAHLRAQAAAVKGAVMTHFWTEDKGGYFVLGTDRDDNGQLRQLNIRTSNMGHVLNSRILDDNNAEDVRKRDAVVAQLLSPEMLAYAGIRTLASDEVRYRAGAYHNGSVWPWDNHIIANGMRRHGLTDAANQVDRRMLRGVKETRIDPEYLRGEQDFAALNQAILDVWDDGLQDTIRLEQPPQEVQAWTVASVIEAEEQLKHAA